MLINPDDLFNHAKDYIEIGVEDYDASVSSDKRKKSSLKSFYCAIELLLKYCLLKSTSTNWGDVFVRSDVQHARNNNNGIILYSFSDKTVSVDEAINRIQALVSLGQEQEKLLSEISNKLSIIKRKRNILEHAHIDHSHDVLDHYIFDSWYVIKKLKEFIENLKFKENISLEKYTNIMKNYDEHQEKYEKYLSKFIKDDREAVRHLFCLHCASKMLLPKDDKESKLCAMCMICEECKKEFSFDQIIQDLITSESFEKTHEAVKPFLMFSEEVLKNFSKKQKEKLQKGIKENTQIYWILSDCDINKFVVKLNQLKS
jgi:hypothetical protein